MCSIRRRGNQNHLCGGTLVDPRWVMTAAHCIDPNIPESAGKSPLIYCGIHQRTDRIVSKRFGVQNCYIHHLWTGSVTEGNDIALCELDGVSASSIPDLVSPGDAFGRLDLFSVLGWGTTSSGSPLADVLQIGSGLRFVPDSICNREKDWTGRITRSMICAGFNDPSDSGGPLLIPDKLQGSIELGDSTVDLIVGITSFGDRRCDLSVPGVYTRVSCYRSWISCVMEGKGQACDVHTPCQDDPSLCAGIARIANLNEANARIETALQSDDSETVKEIICQGSNPNALFGGFNDSLLIRAAGFDAVESAKVLLEHGADIEYKNNNSQTALSRAAASGSVRFLLDAGANIESAVELTTIAGLTPLSLAVWFRHLQVVQILLERGANVDSKTNEGFTPLHLATERSNTDIIKELISNSAKIEARSNLGNTPLHIASYFGSLDVLHILLNEQARVESTNNAGQTPLHYASSRDHVSIVRVLLLNGASKTSTDNDGKTPFDIICTNQFLERPCTNNIINAIRRLLEP